MTKIKICGLTREEDIEAVNEYFPNYIGFVFAKSKRQLSISQAKILKDLLNPAIQSVGVFVNESIENIINFEKEGVIDLIQLHGDEDKAYIEELKTKIKLPIIKALRVKDKIEANHNFDVDFLLLDKYLEDAYGGGGESFNWNTIKDMTMPYFLAGGIHLGNIDEAVKKAPYAIDVSSGAETNGVKDKDKIREIISRVRKHNIKSI